MDNVKKITLLTVRSMLRKNGAITVGLLPNKVRLGNMWMQPHWVTLLSIDDLERTVSEYKYYNCNSELGTNLSYYIKEEV